MGSSTLDDIEGLCLEGIYMRLPAHLERISVDTGEE